MTPQTIIFGLLWVGVILRIFITPEILNLYVSYSTPGGSPLFKIHPGSFVLFFAFAYACTKHSFINNIKQNYKQYKWILQFLFIVTFISVLNVLRFGISNMAYMVDTFIIPMSVLVSMTYLTSQQRNFLAKTILLVLLLNALMAIAEFAMRNHILPHGRFDGFVHFRASALFGHPLNNALITASLAPFLFVTRFPLYVKIGGILLLFASILAFGARGALGIGGLVVLLSLLSIGIVQLFKGKMRLDILIISYASTLIGVALIYGLLFHTPMGDRIISRGVVDENVIERVDSLAFIKSLSTKQLISGIKPEQYMQIVENNQNLGIVENYWVNILVGFGIPMFTLFCLSFFWFLYNLGRHQSIMFNAGILTFILVSSTNNSLTAKTLAFLLFIVVAYGLRHPLKNLRSTDV